VRDPALRRRHISIPRVVADAWRLNRARFGFLLGAAFAVFVPVGFVEALELHEVQTGDIDIVRVIAVMLVAGLFTAITLVGEVLYSGIVAAVVKEDRGQGSHSLGSIVRSLPYGRLVAADLLFVVVVSLGFVALIVPGVVFLAWFCLAAAVIEVERVSVRHAFRRSRELVRRDFWRALAIVLAVTVTSDLVETGITALVATQLGHSLVDRWIESTVSGMITAPIFAFPIVVLYFELRALSEREATSSGTVANA
jgi:hypothetical protein